ncbi:hypothetical protein [Nocardia sp. NPDC024068]|uniref:hypothetical protein n=1 Tax=Nocardia sp. NPDC024068 TaxID=3157197 RepID=UPI0033FA771E
MTTHLTMRIPPVMLTDLERAGAPVVVRNTIDLVDESRTPRTVAYVERELPPGGIPDYLAARKTGARSFVLWADEHRTHRVATLLTRSADRGVATYQVLDAHGAVIGTLVREKAFRGKGVRTRWTMRRADGGEAVGYKGRILWWPMCWLLFPLLPFVVVAAMFQNGDVPRSPRRVKWRGDGRLLLDFRPLMDRLELRAPEVDWRLAAAQLALLRSFDGWFHVSWDSRKK